MLQREGPWKDNGMRNGEIWAREEHKGNKLWGNKETKCGDSHTKNKAFKSTKNRKKSQDKIMETQNLRTNQVKILKTSRCWKNPASTTKKRKVNEAKTRSRQDCKDGRCDLTRSPYLAATWQWGRVHYSAQQSVQGTGRRWWGGRGSQWWAELTGFPSCPCSAPWSPTCTPCHRVWRWPVWLPYIVSQCLCVHVCVCVRGE